jgi:hypothetical protein
MSKLLKYFHRLLFEQPECPWKLSDGYASLTEQELLRRVLHYLDKKESGNGTA